MKNKEIERLKKERDNYEDDYIEERDKIRWGWFISGSIFFFVLFFLISLIIISSIYEQIGLSKDELVSWYVIKYYPEFENCSMKYISCLEENIPFSHCHVGVNIYCYSRLEKRDGLIPYEEYREPTYQLELEDLNINDIFNLYIQENLK